MSIWRFFCLWLLGFLSAKVDFLLQFRPKLAQLIFPDDKCPQFHNSSNFSSCYFPFPLKMQFEHQDSRMIICNICNRSWELIHRVCMLVILMTNKLGSEMYLGRSVRPKEVWVALKFNCGRRTTSQCMNNLK